MTIGSVIANMQCFQVMTNNGKSAGYLRHADGSFIDNCIDAAECAETTYHAGWAVVWNNVCSISREDYEVWKADIACMDGSDCNDCGYHPPRG